MIIFRIFLIIFLSIQLARAQNDQANATTANFQPSLFVVIGVLSFMFSLTFLLLVYAKMCHREPTAIHNLDGNNMGMFGASTRFSGISKEVVESLPFFRFSSLKGAKQGLQCAVCLAEFEDIEILRLLPKCKHGFHIECIDQWLENHSTCPLCRQTVSLEDVQDILNSRSMRLILEDARQPSSNFELFLEREDGEKSSRFGSFRRIFHGKKDEQEQLPIQVQETGQLLHKVNHQIVVSDVVFKNRWSDVSSSDLMFLNSEMLGVMASDRFSSSNLLGVARNYTNDQLSGDDHYSIMNIKEEIDRKRMFESKVGQFKRSSSNSSLRNQVGFDDSIQLSVNPARTSRLVPGDKRAMSEITAVSRFKDLRSMKNKLNQEPYNGSNGEHNMEDIKRRRRKWFPIAKRTVQWFANRENNRSHQMQQSHEETAGQTVDV